MAVHSEWERTLPNTFLGSFNSLKKKKKKVGRGIVSHSMKSWLVLIVWNFHLLAPGKDSPCPVVILRLTEPCGHCGRPALTWRPLNGQQREAWLVGDKQRLSANPPAPETALFCVEAAKGLPSGLPEPCSFRSSLTQAKAPHNFNWHGSPKSPVLQWFPFFPFSWNISPRRGLNIKYLGKNQRICFKEDVSQEICFKMVKKKQNGRKQWNIRDKKLIAAVTGEQVYGESLY